MTARGRKHSINDSERLEQSMHQPQGPLLVEVRYKSQQRNANQIYGFKGATRHSSNTRARVVGQTNIGRADSRVSGTNVSYQSNISAIKLGITKFKYSDESQKREEAKKMRSPQVATAKIHMSTT